MLHGDWWVARQFHTLGNSVELGLGRPENLRRPSPPAVSSSSSYLHPHLSSPPLRSPHSLRWFVVAFCFRSVSFSFLLFCPSIVPASYLLKDRPRSGTSRASFSLRNGLIRAPRHHNRLNTFNAFNAPFASARLRAIGLKENASAFLSLLPLPGIPDLTVSVPLSTPSRGLD